MRDARGGFYGNSYSTFSRGVALLRSVGCSGRAADHSRSCHSYAYDCAGFYEKQDFSRLRTLEPHGQHGCAGRAANRSHLPAAQQLRVRGALGSIEPPRPPKPSLGSLHRAMTKGKGLCRRACA